MLCTDWSKKVVPGFNFAITSVKKWLKSVYIYRTSYHRIKTGVPLFWTMLYTPPRSE